SWCNIGQFQNRKSIEATFTNLVNALVSDENERRRVLEEKGVVENLDCHHDVVQVFDLICIDVNKHDYALQYMNVLNNLCTKFNDSAKIISAMWKTCSENTFSVLLIKQLCERFQ
ncbi:hypothetical protein COOONC_21023, partial [Cooperia oncophora]